MGFRVFLNQAMSSDFSTVRLSEHRGGPVTGGQEIRRFATEPSSEIRVLRSFKKDPGRSDLLVRSAARSTSCPRPIVRIWRIRSSSAAIAGGKVRVRSVDYKQRRCRVVEEEVLIRLVQLAQVVPWIRWSEPRVSSRVPFAEPADERLGRRLKIDHEIGRRDVAAPADRRDADR